jgi:hypothetical protein
MERMPEAEVSLRVAIWLAERGWARERIEIAIDGAEVRTGHTVHFDPAEFLRVAGWVAGMTSAEWRGIYRRPELPTTLQLHSNPGKGDVVALLTSGRILRAECKKGPMLRSPSSQEYRLIREALGQLLTVKEVNDKDILAVAVPHTQKFIELASRWREAPLIKRLSIRILTVDRNGNVYGFPEERVLGQPDATKGALS